MVRRRTTKGPYGGSVSQRQITTAALVSLGGAVGALARYGLDVTWRWTVPEFPLATWTVNVAGCLVIGALLVVLLEGPLTAWWLRPLLAVGLLGGFTTFSALAGESVQLIDADALATAGIYIVASLVMGLFAVWISATMTRRLLIGRRS